MKTQAKKLFISNYLFRIYRLLNSSLRYKGVFIVLLMVVFAFLETGTIGLISLFVSSLTNPQSTISSKLFTAIDNLVLYNYFSNSLNALMFLGCVTFFMIFIKNITKGFYLFVSAKYIAIIEGYIGEKLLYNILYLPYSWHINKNRSNLVLAVSSWRISLGKGFLHPVMTIVADMIVISVLFFSLIVVYPMLSLCIMLTFATFGWIFFALIKISLDKESKENREIEGRIHKESTTAVNGIRDVKISGTESFFIERYTRLVKRAAEKQGYIVMLGQAPALFLEVSGLAVLFVSILILLKCGDYTVSYVTGVVSFLAVSAWKVLPAFTRVISCMTQIRSSLPFLEKMFGYLNTGDQDTEANMIKPKQYLNINFSEDIRLENVFFTYNEKKVFENLNLRIMKNSITGIIGPSGAGKSTLIDIITGCLLPVKGEIRIGDIRITKSNITVWRKFFGYVPQDPYFYDGTLSENIAFGIPGTDMDLELIEKCCEMASIDFVGNLSDGLNTWIGDDGLRLSGGQRQRVAIARALYRNPEIVVFDEATSSLDMKTEKEILNTIYGLKGSRTILMISHNLDSVMLCDSLIWIDSGKIKMHGSSEIVAAHYRANNLKNTS